MFRVIIMAIFTGLLVSATGDTQHFNNYLRSTSATEMYLPQLPEDDSPTPQRSDINADILRKKLGTDYHPRFMSATLPKQIPPNTDGASSSSSNTDKRKWRSPVTNVLKLFKRLQRLPKKSKRKQRKLIMAWYRGLNNCPVQYTWMDLGQRYWPQYVKKGYCQTKKACSIPEGLTCHASEERNMTVMRYHCQGIVSSQQFCSWLKARIPIISNCSCRC